MLDKKNFYINGAWVKPNSEEEIKVIDPATEENCAVITLGNFTSSTISASIIEESGANPDAFKTIVQPEAIAGITFNQS